VLVSALKILILFTDDEIFKVTYKEYSELAFYLWMPLISPVLISYMKDKVRKQILKFLPSNLALVIPVKISIRG